MTYATEFFAVQKALGIENASNVSSSPFKALDEKYAQEGRLIDIQKNNMRGIFVDGEPIVVQFNNQTVNCDKQKAKAFFGL